MGFFSRIKQGVSSKANASLSKAIDPGKEVDLAILEMEEGRKRALVELVTYKATAKLMDQELQSQRDQAAKWEARAMTAVKSGDDETAKQALQEKRRCEAEIKKIAADQQEAQGYAIALNRSRKEFESKLAMLKMRKNTLATQISAARAANGDIFGHDNSVWDKFAAAENKIDDEAIASEVDAAMRGEAAAAAIQLEAGIAALGPTAVTDDALQALKVKMAAKTLNQSAESTDAKPVVSLADRPADIKKDSP